MTGRAFGPHEKCLLGTLKGNIPLERRGCRWIGHIKMSLIEIEWEGMDLSHLAEDWDYWWTV